jgi:hypothetical protein
LKAVAVSFLIEEIVGIILATLQLRDDHGSFGLAVRRIVETVGHALGLDEQHPIERVARSGLDVRRLVKPRVSVPEAAELLNDSFHLVARNIGRALEVHVLDPVGDSRQPGPLIA